VEKLIVLLLYPGIGINYYRWVGDGQQIETRSHHLSKLSLDIDDFNDHADIACEEACSKYYHKNHTPMYRLSF